MAYQVNGLRVEWNPTAARLRELTEEMPNASVTEFGNVAVKARVDSRSTRSTYIVEDSTNSRGQTITRAEYDRVAALQDAHIATSHMVVVDGYIGSDPSFRTRARLIMEAANANVAGMQKQLYYPVDEDYDPATWEPATTVIYTPNLQAPGYPNDRLIAVDLASSITRVLNSDYFGESKKGGLRMWNNIVYRRGGLALHAGCKVIPVHGTNKTVLIVGLSGTGKTTTTFTTQLGSKPAQDDFVALMPGGRVYTTENGCFAKTFGLDPAYEPVIYNATTKPDAYLENVSVDDAGKVDFFDTSYTKNGRTTWPFSYVDPWPADQVAPGPVPAHPEPQREHPAGRGPPRPDAGRGLLHARRDHGYLGRRQGRGRQVPARPGDQPVLPARHGRHGEPDARTARQPRGSVVRSEHRAYRRGR